MGLRDWVEDARDNVLEFARTPVPEGTLLYRSIGWWLRIACWVLVALALTSLVAVVALFVIFVGLGAVTPTSFSAVLWVIVMTGLAGTFLVMAVMALGLSVGLVALVDFIYGGWVHRRPAGLWGLRAIGGAILLVGLGAVLLQFSPFSLFVATLALAATGALVILASFLPSLRREFAAAPSGA